MSCQSRASQMVLRLLCGCQHQDGGTSGHHPEACIDVSYLLCAGPLPGHRHTAGTSCFLLLRTRSGNASHTLVTQALLPPSVLLAVRCVFRDKAVPSVALSHSKAGPCGNHRSLAF